MRRLDHYWSSINFISLLLLPLSFLFFLLSQLRKYLYHSGFYSSYQSPVPVIIIGNITVGGTGKTPLIIELVKQLQARGKKPGVISRGYGGKANSWPRIVNAQTDASQVGDEPQLIYQHTLCPIVVGPDRKADIELLLQQFDCDVILSDDGMQHYALQRNFEICIVDASRKYGNGFFIPAGPLRESLSRLEQVDLVLLNGGLNDELSFEMQPKKCIPVASNNLSEVDLKKFSGETVHAIAGIGNPQRFFSMLEVNGVNVIPHAYQDHHYYQLSDLLFEDNLNVLMTEKDAIKCRELKLEYHWSVPVDIVLSETAQNKVNQIFDRL